jgi:hypothetical protein
MDEGISLKKTTRATPEIARYVAAGAAAIAAGL